MSSALPIGGNTYGDVTIRRARTKDVGRIRELVDLYSQNRRLLSKATVSLYEDVPDFLVAERDGYAEVRTLGVDPEQAGQGVGRLLLDELIVRARQIGVQRVFVLTFEVDFFLRAGFAEIVGTPVDHHVFAQLLQSYDEGVAEFLDLERVKPNTLGNARLLLIL